MVAEGDPVGAILLQPAAQVMMLSLDSKFFPRSPPDLMCAAVYAWKTAVHIELFKASFSKCERWVQFERLKTAI